MAEQSLTPKQSNPEQVERTHTRPTYIPPTDIYEKSNALVVVADIPGVDEKSVNVHLEKGILTITGHVPVEEKKEYRLLHCEYETGDYQRNFAVTEDIDPEKIEAAIKNGVLTLTLHKAEKAKARKIPIRVEK